MATEELDLLIQTVAQALQSAVNPAGFGAAHYDIWLHFLRKESDCDREILPAVKVVEEAMTEKELIYKVAEQIVLAVFGSEVSVLADLPNLHVRLLGQKAEVHLPGAPELEALDQVFLKVTVSRHEKGLWQQLFGGKES